MEKKKFKIDPKLVIHTEPEMRTEYSFEIGAGMLIFIAMIVLAIFRLS